MCDFVSNAGSNYPSCCTPSPLASHSLAPPPHPWPRLLTSGPSHSPATQAHSAQVSSVPLPSGCPVAPPTCEIMSARITSTIESRRCRRAASRARRACLVCSRCRAASCRRRHFCLSEAPFPSSSHVPFWDGYQPFFISQS